MPMKHIHILTAAPLILAPGVRVDRRADRHLVAAGAR
jgi:hypothetical protein